MKEQSEKEKKKKKRKREKNHFDHRAHFAPPISLTAPAGPSPTTKGGQLVNLEKEKKEKEKRYLPASKLARLPQFLCVF